MIRALLTASLLAAAFAWAAPLAITTAQGDRPTVHALGVQVLISGDEDRDARITVRYRQAGSPTWSEGPPLFRVHPDTTAVAVPEQFAGSLFDLTPGTAYEVELRAVDPDGTDETRVLALSTRPVPRSEPATPRVVNVANTTALKAALSSAAAGDVITLAAGTYPGQFSISASGTAQNPIVLRGAAAAAVILDGQGCSACNVLEVYGSYLHVERITLANATRGLRFLGTGATGNVARRLIIQNVVHGIGSNTGQSDFYLCDNDIDGRLVWPWVLAGDATSHWDDRGVDVTGDGHVICHNKLRGFGDPVVNKKLRSRSWDVHGNDIWDSFDGTELDESEGNSRLYGNRWTNVMAPISIQPVYGGPAYVLRNVLFNVGDEQIKLKSLGGTQEPSGALILHNTFISPKLALNLQTPITQHNFVISNNLFVAPRTLAGTRVVDWTATLDQGLFDYDGYFPNGGFFFGKVAGVNRVYANFAAAQAAGVEPKGVLLTEPIFASGVVGPVDLSVRAAAADFTLAGGSNALDRGLGWPGINGHFVGVAPDLGALELGCPAPVYGPRGEGQEGTTNPVDCRAQAPSPDAGSPDGGSLESDGGAPGQDAGLGEQDAGRSGPDGGLVPEPTGSAGCGCGATGPGALAGLVLLLGWATRRPRFHRY